VGVQHEIEVGAAPHGLRFSPDGRRGYLAEAGSGTVAVLDVAGGFVRERWDAGESPLDLVPDGEGGFWVTQFRGAALLHLDARGRETGRLEVGAGPSLFTPRAYDGRFGLVSERADRFVSFDPSAGSVVQEFTTGARPYPAAVTRDGVLSFVPNAGDGTVSVLDLLNWETAATVEVGGRPRGGALTVDDVSYVVATSDPDALVYVNTASFEVTSRVSTGVGPAPFSVCIPGDGRYGIVNDSGGSTVSILDVAARRVLGKLPVGSQPIVMRAHPDGRHVHVSCEESNTVSVLGLPEPPPPAPFVAPNEVLVMGMIHGDHETSERYGLDMVRALFRVIDPDVICVEIPPNRMDAVREGWRREGEVNEPRARRFPEYREVLFPLLDELHAEVIGTAGWTEPMARYRRDALARIAEDPMRKAEWDEYEAAQAASEKAVAAGGAPDDPRWIHTDAYDTAAEIELDVYNRLFNDELGPGGWDRINAAHYANIERVLDRRSGQGLRVLITYGAYHKGWFLRKLRERKDIRLLDMAPFLGEAEELLRAQQ